MSDTTNTTSKPSIPGQPEALQPVVQPTLPQQTPKLDIVDTRPGAENKV